jgi:hypothetical protein
VARRLAVISTAAALVWPVTGQAARVRAAVGPAAAAPAAEPTTPAPATTTAAPTGSQPGQPDMDEVKRIYAAGKTKYETKNYSGAIDDWTNALGMLPNTPENREIRNDLVYNIATAQEKAYDIDKDVAHLRTARALLVDFLEAYKALYRPDEQTVAEFKRVNERIAALDAKIAEAEKGGPPPAAPVTQKRRLDLEVNQALKSDPVLWKQYKTGRSLGAERRLGQRLAHLERAAHEPERRALADGRGARGCGRRRSAGRHRGAEETQGKRRGALACGVRTHLRAHARGRSLRGFGRGGSVLIRAARVTTGFRVPIVARPRR